MSVEWCARNRERKRQQMWIIIGKLSPFIVNYESNSYNESLTANQHTHKKKTNSCKRQENNTITLVVQDEETFSSFYHFVLANFLRKQK